GPPDLVLADDDGAFEFLGEEPGAARVARLGEVRQAFVVGFRQKDGGLAVLVSAEGHFRCLSHVARAAVGGGGGGGSARIQRDGGRRSVAELPAHVAAARILAAEFRASSMRILILDNIPPRPERRLWIAQSYI